MVHWLHDHWDSSPDSTKAVWAYGPEASARLQLAGRDATLRLVVSTSPALSEAGQTCTVLERYADSAAAMVHMGNFGEKFAPRFLALLDSMD